MAKEIENRVREYLERRLNLKFEATHLDIGTREKVDGWIQLAKPWLLILEVEDQQPHPTTNVLKLWPFLEARRDVAAVLVHVYFPTSRAVTGSRSDLATWLGNRLERMFPKRFKYQRLDINWVGDTCQGYEDLVRTVQSLSHGRTSCSNRSRVKRAPV